MVQKSLNLYIGGVGRGSLLDFYYISCFLKGGCSNFYSRVLTTGVFFSEGIRLFEVGGFGVGKFVSSFRFRYFAKGISEFWILFYREDFGGGGGYTE